MTIQQKLDLKGRVALVTGASKGIGEAIARGMAELGASVVVSSRKQDAVDAVAEAFRADGLEAHAIAARVGDEGVGEQIVADTVARYGGLHIIVNNAATNPYFGPVQGIGDDAFAKIMQVNLKGAFDICKAAHSHLSKEGGSIINIASVGGLRPEAMLGIYNVSKAALVSLTQVMAKEWGPAGIRANAICPGLIKTKLSQALWENDSLLKESLGEQPIPRIGQPDEIAGLACLLASDAGAYMTGGVYTVDGGFTI